MTDRPAGLSTARRDRAEHQQSLAASLDWSRRFLSDGDAKLLNRLAVFVGGFTARSVRELEHLDGSDELYDTDPIDGLSRLVDHSLVGFDQTDGRYRMLEVVRLDALDRLDDGQRRAVEAAHLSVCQGIVTSLAENMYEADPDNRFPRFVLELPNLCAALRRTYHAGDLDAFRSLLGPMAVWLVHYVAPEHPRTWEEVFEHESVPIRWRANVQTAIAFFWSHRGRPDQALHHADAGAALHRKAEDLTGLALALNAAANAQLVLGEREAATRTYRQALDEALRAGSAYGELVVRVSLARLDPSGDTGLEHLTAARSLAAGGFAAIEASVVTGLGLHRLRSGDRADSSPGRSTVGEARRLCDEALDKARRLGYPEVVAESLCGRAVVAEADGDIEQAEILYREALTIGRRRVHQGVIDQASAGLAGLAPSGSGQHSGTASNRLTDTDGVNNGDRVPGGGGDVQLSDRELSVARLLRGDLTQREIADELYIAPSTVKTHIKSIYRKLGVAKRSSAVTRAAELGLFNR